MRNLFILLLMLAACKPSGNPINAGGFKLSHDTLFQDPAAYVDIGPGWLDTTSFKEIQVQGQSFTIYHSEKYRAFVRQEIFYDLGTWHLVTSDGSLYDNVVHGTREYVESQKPIEYARALLKRKPVAVVKCD